MYSHPLPRQKYICTNGHKFETGILKGGKTPRCPRCGKHTKVDESLLLRWLKRLAK